MANADSKLAHAALLFASVYNAGYDWPCIYENGYVTFDGARTYRCEVNEDGLWKIDDDCGFKMRDLTVEELMHYVAGRERELWQ